MTFIITLISLVIERFFYWGHLRYWRWFTKYQRWLSTSRIGNWPPVLQLIVCILPLLLVVGLLNCLLAGWLYGILKLIFGVVIVVYCFGPHNIWVQVYACINELHKGDMPLAMEHADTAFKVGTFEQMQKFHQTFVRAIFVAMHERVFAVVFWFVLLGPVGAVLYRAITLMSHESPLNTTQLAAKIRLWLDWISVRVFTFIFALGGHFTEVFKRWKQTVFKGPETNEAMLTECGVAALDVMDGELIPEEGVAEKEAIKLLDRVLIMGLVILAILVLLEPVY
ncbi:MAG: hypothetical protein ACD_45C00408G0002 [uncultured bacterium]|nr:MAG: hypothetical protein ACD_45C00408G0002 [uncultured bacterium]